MAFQLLREKTEILLRLMINEILRFSRSRTFPQTLLSLSDCDWLHFTSCVPLRCVDSHAILSVVKSPFVSGYDSLTATPLSLSSSIVGFSAFSILLHILRSVLCWCERRSFVEIPRVRENENSSKKCERRTRRKKRRFSLRCSSRVAGKSTIFLSRSESFFFSSSQKCVIRFTDAYLVQ